MSLVQLKIEYEEFESTDLLLRDEQKLVDSALKARKTAYAPYSRFRVGAAVSSINGRIFRGSNQETANYKGSCAERVALDAISVGGFKDRVAKIAVVGSPDSESLASRLIGCEELLTPCGQCRQDLKEVEDLSGAPITIILASRNRVLRILGIGTLLPLAFGPANLGISVREL